MTIEHNSTNKIWLLTIALVLILAGGGYWLWLNTQDKSEEQVACTMEAKICPDGSAVGRVGPDCAFAPCPGSNQSIDTSTWASTTDATAGISFNYPRDLAVKYTSTVDWPPQIQVLNQSFNCQEGGNLNDRSDQTVAKTIGNRTYCVTTISEGAAGSVYTQYSYAFDAGDATIILTFSLRRPQCGNYPQPEQADCQREQADFALDQLIDQIVATFR